MSLNYNPDWNRKSTSTGYEVTYCPDHPRAWSTGYVYTHVLIAEQKLGRLLEPDEIVHHKNENRKDNNPENIKITNQSDHAREHQLSHGHLVAVLKCPMCDKIFEKRRNQTYLINGRVATFCSRKCNGTFQRKKQMKERLIIKDNIIRIERRYNAPISQLDREQAS